MSAQDSPVYNISGALIFSAYIISALVLTVFIVYSLSSLYHKRFVAKNATQTKELGLRLQVFSALSVLSFSTLSYHMLNYLIVSYQSWAESNSIALPDWVVGGKGLLAGGGVRVKLHFWQWLTRSNLTKQFAKNMCGTYTRCWFDQQALLVLYIWQWLTSSTLFKDFAGTICGTNTRFWWTQQALLVTMGWSIFMSFEGLLCLPFHVVALMNR